MNLLFFNFISSRYFYGKDRDLMPAKQQPADLCCDKATLSIASKDSQSHGWVQVWGNWLRRSGWDMLCVQAGRTSRLLQLYHNQAGEAGRGTLWSEIGQLRTAGKGKVGYSLALALCLCKDWTLCCCGCWPSTPPERSSGQGSGRRHPELCEKLAGQDFSYLFSETDFMSPVLISQIRSREALKYFTTMTAPHD